MTGSNIWVVGDRVNAAGPIESLAWHSSRGSKWTSYRPDPYLRGVLNGVHATSPTDVWAAGTPGNDGTGDGVLLTRWNGRHWQPAFRISTIPALRGLADVTTAAAFSRSAAALRRLPCRTDVSVLQSSAVWPVEITSPAHRVRLAAADAHSWQRPRQPQTNLGSGNCRSDSWVFPISGWGLLLSASARVGLLRRRT